MGIREEMDRATALPTRVAIVGAGYTATEHARAFRDVPGVTLAGVHSRTRATAETFASGHGIPLVCDSIGELYERTRADLVVLTVGELAMQSVSRACFDFPWTVLMEKPPGYCLSDAHAIASAARARGRRVFVALNRRFLASTERARAEVDATNGQRFIKVQDQENQSQGRDLGKPEDVVENWMFANAIHTIDYFRVFGRGKVSRIHSVVPWDPEHPGVVVVRIDFNSGDLGLYEGIWHGPGPWAVSVTVPGRRWEMRPLEHLETQTLGQRPERHEPDMWDREYKPGFRAQAEHAVAASLGLPSALVSLDEALETMELIAAIFRVD